MISRARLAAAGAAASIAICAGAAEAVTIGFEGPDVDPYVEAGFSFGPDARLVNGNCLSGACLALNDNEEVELTSSGGVFTLQSINFMLLGQGTPNVLTVSGDNGASVSFGADVFGANSGYNLFDFAGLFANVSLITFGTLGGGNVRIDDIGAVAPIGGPTPIPLPAAGALLLGGLGLFGWLGRRRAA